MIFGFFNLGFGEIFAIFVVVLLLFGADKIPDIAKGLGKGMRTLKDATNDIKHEISKSADNHGIDTDVVKDVNEEITKVKDNIDDFTGSVRRKL